jgi:hypothetical protein
MLHDKNSKQSKYRRILSEHIKCTLNTILNEKELDTFLLKSIRWGYPLLGLLFSLILEFLAKETTRKEIKCIQIGKEDVKLSKFIYNIILDTEKATDSTKRLLELMNEFRIQNQHAKIIEFYIPYIFIFWERNHGNNPIHNNYRNI